MNSHLIKIKRILDLRIDEISKYTKYFFQKRKPLKSKFVLVCDYRSGSTLLANLLNQHPEIYCDDEIFIPFVESKLERVVWPYGYLQGRIINAPKSIYGFDCKVSQIGKMGVNPQNTTTQFFENLYRNNWKFIYLKRVNIVRQSLSNYIANARNQWHDRPSEILERRKVTVDINSFQKEIKSRQKISILSEQLMFKIPHLQVVYEDDLLSSDCHENTIKRICGYLNAPVFYHETDMRRVSTNRLSNDIDNFKEVIYFLRSSPYSHHIDFDD
ncbi:MAG: hypothetical protein ACFB0C_12450 [Leptolyngbyaceae cyanobacterium]